MRNPQTSRPDLQKEIALLEQGYRFVAGLDEAGRGAWAGPVVAAAVLLPLNHPDLRGTLAGLNDSKKLNPKIRDRFFALIQETALATAVGMASAAMVDQINVVEATRRAMHQAVERLDIAPDYLLIDHLTLPALNVPQSAFPKADSISLSVAAASIIAKVSRDRLMVQHHRAYPGYAFDRHKGYGTRAHQAALEAHGPTPLHRMTFAPLQALDQPIEI